MQSKRNMPLGSRFIETFPGNHPVWASHCRQVDSSKEGLLNLACFGLVARLESSKGCNGRSEAGHAAERASGVVEPSGREGLLLLLLEHDGNVADAAVIGFS